MKIFLQITFIQIISCPRILDYINFYELKFYLQKENIIDHDFSFYDKTTFIECYSLLVEFNYLNFYYLNK